MTEPSPHILVCDDHAEIREPLATYLQRHGMRTTLAQDGKSLRQALARGAFDLVVLDIMLPGEDGLSLCRELRATANVPVILLTALGEDTDRIVGLEVGADDYVVKPFNPRELLARIKAVLRRAHSLPPQRQADQPPPAAQVRFGPWTLDHGARELTGADGVVVALSTAEYRLLSTFLAHPNIVLSREQLLDLTAGREAALFDRSIDNQVSRLRRKIEPDPKRPRLIKTHWGGGYSFTAGIARP